MAGLGFEDMTLLLVFRSQITNLMYCQPAGATVILTHLSQLGFSHSYKVGQLITWKGILGGIFHFNYSNFN